MCCGQNLTLSAGGRTGGTGCDESHLNPMTKTARFVANLPRLSHLSTRVLALVAATGLAGCNVLTGADELTVGSDTEDDGDGGDTSGPGAGPGPGSGAGGAGAGHQGGAGGAGPGSGAAGGAGGAGGGPVAPEGDATGVEINEVAFYQAVKSTVWENGSAQTPTVSIVANRPAVVRVFASASGTTGSPVTARLIMGNNPPIEQTVQSFGNASEGSYNSTINFDVPAGYMASGNWRVEFKEPASSSQGANPSANTGDASMQMRSSKALKVTLIPVQYQADGSNRMPDTTPGQVEAYRAAFMAEYPATDVILSVGPTLAWGNTVSAGGGGWETLLNAVTDERTSSNADFDEYYFGIFNPANSFNSYCSGGCVLGLGWIGGPNAEYTRAAIGIGYSGETATETAVHEIGHNHGREHSPCGGVSGADPQYPHSGGNIGVWAMNIFTHELFPPDHKDFMTYCHPQWISDYTYENILDFMGATGSSIQFPEASLNQVYDRISIGESAAMFMDSKQMPRPPLGDELESITLTLADGTTKTVQGNYYRYDHLPGGVLYVKQQPVAIQSLEAELSIDGLQSTIVQAVR